MSEIGTGYLRRVIIEAENGKAMKDLDFELKFFVYTNRPQIVTKKDLAHVVKDGEDMYFAKIYSEKVGRGVLKCMATIIDQEPRWDNMKRPVVLVRDVGIIIGSCCCNTTISHVCNDFEEGFKLRFEEVNDIPTQDAKAVRYGIIKQDIASYADITEAMVLDFEVADGLNNFAMNVNVGDKVVVLVDADLPNHATKNNGFGEFVPFNTDVLGSNGEYTTQVESKYYRIYGEMMLVSGTLYVNLNN